MSTEVLTYILGAATFLLSVLFGIVWKFLRDESKSQAEEIKQKANNTRMREIETTLANEIREVRETNAKLINRLEERHDRDLEQVANRLSMQIQNTEGNILAQLRLMLGVIRNV